MEMVGGLHTLYRFRYGFGVVVDSHPSEFSGWYSETTDRLAGLSATNTHHLVVEAPTGFRWLQKQMQPIIQTENTWN